MSGAPYYQQPYPYSGYSYPYQYYPNQFHPPPHQFASLLSRFAARLLDSLIIGIILFPFIVAFILLFVTDSSAFADPVSIDATLSDLWLLIGFIVVSFTIDILYYTLMEGGSRNATFGKRVMGIKVVDESYRPITKSAAFVRNFCRFSFLSSISYIILLIDIILIALTDTRQRIGDRIAHTYVVKNETLGHAFPQYYPFSTPYFHPQTPPASESEAACNPYEER